MNSGSAARKSFDKAMDCGDGSAGQGRPRSRDFNAVSLAFMALGDVRREWGFAILIREYVGMVPVTARKSDLVVIVSGARVPYVIRPVSGHAGACSLHIIMQGELLDDKIDLDGDEFYFI